MPKARIKAPGSDTERLLIANINYEMQLKGYGKNDLVRVLGLSLPAVNKRYKEPKWFRFGELMLLARWLRIPVSNFFIDRPADVKKPA